MTRVLAVNDFSRKLAVNDFSRKIVGLITIPQKNAITHYNALMRPLSEGMWEQIKVDHGTEFVLIVAVQQELASLWPQRQHSYSV